MRKLWLVFTSLALAGLLAWSAPFLGMVVGINGVEEAAFETLARDGALEIRRYTAQIVARTEVPASTVDPDGEAFRRLAGYIFGHNAVSTEIAMTAPVTMEPAGMEIAMTAPVVQEPRGDAWRYTFMMPAALDMAALPTPLDSRVVLEERPPQTVASFGFSGSAASDAIERHVDALESWLTDNGYEAVGPARLARYDPPWCLPFLRRNEVQIAVRARVAG